MGSIDVAYRSAGALVEEMAARRVSPVEVMDSTLRLVEEREPSLNAIVYRGFDEARETARAAEASIAAVDGSAATFTPSTQSRMAWKRENDSASSATSRLIQSTPAAAK